MLSFIFQRKGKHILCDNLFPPAGNTNWCMPIYMAKWSVCMSFLGVCVYYIYFWYWGYEFEVPSKLFQNNQIIILLDFMVHASALCPYRNRHMAITSSFIYNCQNLGATELSLGRWMDKLIHSENGMLFSTERKWAIEPWKHREKTSVHIISEKAHVERLHTVWFQLCLL